MDTTNQHINTSSQHINTSNQHINTSNQHNNTASQHIKSIHQLIKSTHQHSKPTYQVNTACQDMRIQRSKAQDRCITTICLSHCNPPQHSKYSTSQHDTAATTDAIHARSLYIYLMRMKDEREESTFLLLGGLRGTSVNLRIEILLLFYNLKKGIPNIGCGH